MHVLESRYPNDASSKVNFAAVNLFSPEQVLWWTIFYYQYFTEQIWRNYARIEDIFRWPIYLCLGSGAWWINYNWRVKAFMIIGITLGCFSPYWIRPVQRYITYFRSCDGVWTESFFDISALLAELNWISWRFLLGNRMKDAKAGISRSPIHCRGMQAGSLYRLNAMPLARRDNMGKNLSVVCCHRCLCSSTRWVTDGSSSYR